MGAEQELSIDWEKLVTPERMADAEVARQEIAKMEQLDSRLLDPHFVIEKTTDACLRMLERRGKLQHTPAWYRKQIARFISTQAPPLMGFMVVCAIAEGDQNPSGLLEDVVRFAEQNRRAANAMA